MGFRRKLVWRLSSFLVGGPNRRSLLSFPLSVRRTKLLLSILIFVASLLYLLGPTETLTVIGSLMYCVGLSGFILAKFIALFRGKRGKNRSRVSRLETILTDDEIVDSVVSGETASEELESVVRDCERAVVIRREALRQITGKGLVGLPLHGFDYASSSGRLCELKVGCVQLPVGVPGPLLLDGSQYYVPMATTEGCLVASVSRGFKAIALSGGATSVIFGDSITPALVVRLPSASRAAELQFFLENPNNLDTLTELFNRSSRFARLQKIKCALAGRNCYMRFRCSTEDDAGMNIVSEGVRRVLDYLQLNNFNDMEAISTSINLCSENKPVAVNWIEGRGKSVACEAIVKEEVVKQVLKTSIPALVELHKIKNLVGSAVAGSLGGFNAQASNIISAIFIATGQDPAANVESSQCITMMEALNDGKELHVSVTLPSIEVGTIGRGTELAAQAACLNLLGVQGQSLDSPGANARRLATIIAGAVLAGELSLLSALEAGHLVKSHMKYNRSSNKNIGHQTN